MQLQLVSFKIDLWWAHIFREIKGRNNIPIFLIVVLAAKNIKGPQTNMSLRSMNSQVHFWVKNILTDADGYVQSPMAASFLDVCFFEQIQYYFLSH